MEDFDNSSTGTTREISDLQKTIAVWGIVALGLAILLVNGHSTQAASASFLAKAFAALIGTVTGIIGALIGDAIRKFAKPDSIITSGGMGSIIWTKLFWMIGPQAVGVLIGTALGAAIVLK